MIDVGTTVGILCISSAEEIMENSATLRLLVGILDMILIVCFINCKVFGTMLKRDVRPRNISAVQSRQETGRLNYYVQFLAGTAQFGLCVGKLHCQVLAVFFGEYRGLGGLVSTGAAYGARELLRLQVISLLSKLQDQLTNKQKKPTHRSSQIQAWIALDLLPVFCHIPLYKANKIQCSV